MSRLMRNQEKIRRRLYQGRWRSKEARGIDHPSETKARKMARAESRDRRNEEKS